MELNTSKTDKAIIEAARILAAQDKYDWDAITYGTRLTYIHRVRSVIKAFIKAGYRPAFRRMKCQVK